MRQWNNPVGIRREDETARSRVSFECPKCEAEVMGMQHGFTKCECCDERLPVHFALCLHCSSAYVVVVGGNSTPSGVNEYTLERMSDQLDQAYIDKIVPELRRRLQAETMPTNITDA
ncbi:MAG: hypothetical protein ACYC69_02780 [Thermodesulfovibrionales bacterium]